MNLSNQTSDNIRFAIKVLELDMPRYVYTAVVFVLNLSNARLFRTSGAALNYAKKHENIACRKYEIIEVEI